jgi:pimeloyl-ACP methyl ester carboxylesterase
MLIAAALAACCALASAPLAPAALAAAPVFKPTRFTVQVTGSGPDVILIPGLTASREVWKSTVAAMPGYRYHLIQVNGFAGTAAGANAKGAVVEPIAGEIARYISAAGLQKPALVGHSMGGTLAMLVGSRHPERVGKVMVVDMLPQPAGLVGSSASGVRGLADALRDLGTTPSGRRLVESLMGMFGHPESTNSRSDPDLVARATHELALLDLGPQLPRIKAPLTVVYAIPDPRRRTAIERGYSSAYAPAKGAKLVPIQDSGHMLMYDKPAEFRAALKAFLKS